MPDEVEYRRQIHGRIWRHGRANLVDNLFIRNGRALTDSYPESREKRVLQTREFKRAYIYLAVEGNRCI